MTTNAANAVAAVTLSRQPVGRAPVAWMWRRLGQVHVARGWVAVGARWHLAGIVAGAVATDAAVTAVGGWDLLLRQRMLQVVPIAIGVLAYLVVVLNRILRSRVRVATDARAIWISGRWIDFDEVAALRCDRATFGGAVIQLDDRDGATLVVSAGPVQPVVSIARELAGLLGCRLDDAFEATVQPVPAPTPKSITAPSPTWKPVTWTSSDAAWHVAMRLRVLPQTQAAGLPKLVDDTEPIPLLASRPDRMIEDPVEYGCDLGDHLPHPEHALNCTRWISSGVVLLFFCFAAPGKHGVAFRSMPTTIFLCALTCASTLMMVGMVALFRPRRIRTHLLRLYDNRLFVERQPVERTSISRLETFGQYLQIEWIGGVATLKLASNEHADWMRVRLLHWLRTGEARLTAATA